MNTRIEKPVSDAQTTLAELRAEVATFVREREWEKFHDPKNLSMAIAIEAAELMEHFQWTRSEDLARVIADPAIRSEISDELADITCFVLAMSNALGLDLAQAVTSKIVKNRAKYPADRFRGVYFKPAKSADAAPVPRGDGPAHRGDDPSPRGDAPCHASDADR